MRVIIKLIFCLTLTHTLIKAQNPSIQLNILTDLSAIDFAAFAIEENLSNQPRIMQVIIEPQGIDVIVNGNIVWRKDPNSTPLKVVEFTTQVFKSRTFSNDEFDVSDIEIETIDYNSDVVKEILKIGKPTGIFNIQLNLYSPITRELYDSDIKELVFLNPTPPEIISPQEGEVENIGSILITWTETPGANSYQIIANYLKANQSYEEALKSGNLLVNNKDVGKVNNIELRNILDRELLEDTTVVLAVKAIVNKPGGVDELISKPVSFRIGRTQVSTQTQEPSSLGDIQHLANLIQQLGNNEVANLLKDRTIKPEQLQFTDENGNIISYADFQSILNYLVQNHNVIISVNFIPR